MFPELISSLSLKLQGTWVEVQVFGLCDQARAIVFPQGGQRLAHVCGYVMSNGSRDFLGVGVTLPIHDVAYDKLVWWMPRFGLLRVIDMLTGKLQPTVESLFLFELSTQDLSTDPQRENMLFFRKRCRYDVLRVIQERLHDPAGPGSIDVDTIRSSQRRTRLYDREDLVSGLEYWANRGILTNATFGPRYTIDESTDDEVEDLIADYDWEEGERTMVTSIAGTTEKVDVFISHASEDKDEFVRPLAKALKAQGLSVWYDEYSLALGDSLRRSIDQGLVAARYGVVVLSQAFFRKEWPQRELDGLVAKEVASEKVILPVWHNITAEQVREYSPTLADRVAIKSESGIPSVVNSILQVVRPVAG